MKWFKRKKKGIPEYKPPLPPEPKVENKYKGFDIEYYHLSGRYYPRYKGKYIMRLLSGGYILVTLSCCGDFGKSENEARNIIDLYLEFQGVGTKIIKL